MRRRGTAAPPGTVERWATGVLLLGGGLVLLLIAMRLVAAAFSWSFSPFAYLPLPDGHGWRALLLLVVAVACAALLPLVLRRDDGALWLEGARGHVVVGVPQVEALLRDEALAHPEVVTAAVEVRVRKAAPYATLELALRPLVAGDGVSGEVAAAARERLRRLTAVPEAEVRVRHRVLSVSQLAKELP